MWLKKLIYLNIGAKNTQTSLICTVMFKILRNLCMAAEVTINPGNT